jgi:uncharacterized protein
VAGKGTAKLGEIRPHANNQRMLLRRFTSADRFRAATTEFLARHEAHNNLLLGIAAGLADRQVRAATAYMAMVEDADGGPASVALMTPPWNLLLSWPFHDAAISLVADDLLAGDRQPPGVLGQSRLAERFARTWQERTGAEPRLMLAQRIYQLERVEPVAGVPGRLVRADDGHRSMVIDWLAGFDRDAGTTPPISADERADSFLRGPDRELYLWFDGGPVSMAATAGPTPHGLRISAVYTPPELRRRGYASACVAALSQRVLDSGRRYCFLFTDLANPTSNHIYQQIGYQGVSDVDLYTWQGA